MCVSGGARIKRNPLVTADATRVGLAKIVELRNGDTSRVRCGHVQLGCAVHVKGGWGTAIGRGMADERAGLVKYGSGVGFTCSLWGVGCGLGWLGSCWLW